MSALNRTSRPETPFVAEAPRPETDRDRMACLFRVGDAIAAIDSKLTTLSDDDPSVYTALAREFETLQAEACAIRAWDLAEIALAGERVFSSAALRGRGLIPDERRFFDNVLHTLEAVAANPETSEGLDMDLIGDALDRLLDDLGVD